MLHGHRHECSHWSDPATCSCGFATAHVPVNPNVGRPDFNEGATDDAYSLDQDKTRASMTKPVQLDRKDVLRGHESDCGKWRSLKAECTCGLGERARKDKIPYAGKPVRRDIARELKAGNRHEMRDKFSGRVRYLIESHSPEIIRGLGLPADATITLCTSGANTNTFSVRQEDTIRVFEVTVREVRSFFKPNRK
jgi:hypothetical protein